jgi:hypothetical protein
MTASDFRKRPVLLTLLIVLPFAMILGGLYLYADYFPKQHARQDLQRVANKLVLFRHDTGHFPSEVELNNQFSVNPRYTPPLLGIASTYPWSLSYDSNFFYCRDSSNDNFLVVVNMGDTGTLTLIDKTQKVRNFKDKEYPDNILSFHVHLNSSEVCNALAPQHDVAMNGFSGQWSRWTGVKE